MPAPRLLALLVPVATLLSSHSAHALVTTTLSGSMGQSAEFHPERAPVATNVMVTGGLGLLWDHVRPELGLVGSYGAVRAHRNNSVKYEIRPMLRLSAPLVPLYLRLVVAGLSPFDRARALAYGGGLGVSLGAFGVSVFGEAGVLPRYVDRAVHWIIEGRLGVGIRL